MAPKECLDGDSTTISADDVAETAPLTHFVAATIIPEPTSELRRPRRQSARSWGLRLSILLALSLLVNIVLSAYFVTQRTVLKRDGRVSADQSSSSSSSSSNSTVSWRPLPDRRSTITKIVFGSCADQNYPQTHWDTVAKESPDLLLLMGDNVYGNCDDAQCTTLQQAYANWSDHAAFQGLAQSTPILATLDDHDYGRSNAGADNPYKDVAKHLFLDFFDIHDARRTRHNDGVYQKYLFGPDPQSTVQIVMLDTRYAKSSFAETARNETQRQILSPRQWTWLEEALQVPAKVRIIVTSYQALNGVTPFESWRHIPSEFDRLHQLLKREQDNSLVLLLSGDRHVGGFYGYDGLFEITASSWTHTIALDAFDENCHTAQDCDEVDDRRWNDFVRVNHYGVLELDWEAGVVQGSLRRVDMSPQYRYRSGLRQEAGHVLQEYSYAIP